jgi:predicted O-methyltransferase YrrM
MATEFRTQDWDRYRMRYEDPHRELEPAEAEVDVVRQALEALRAAAVLPHTEYDDHLFREFRRAVRERFEIPWTAITPRMQRLIYAVNAIARPRTMIAAGVFCGFTFICNAGAGAGPGACYEAGRLIGVEIRPQEAERAERNVRRVDPSGVARVVAADALDVLADFKDSVDLLYLDADGAGGKGKGIYREILDAAYDRIPADGLVLAHNSENAASRLKHYLERVRDPGWFRSSVNVVLDPEGLEVSAK